MARGPPKLVVEVAMGGVDVAALGMALGVAALMAALLLAALLRGLLFAAALSTPVLSSLMVGLPILSRFTASLLITSFATTMVKTINSKNPSPIAPPNSIPPPTPCASPKLSSDTPKRPCWTAN